MTLRKIDRRSHSMAVMDTYGKVLYFVCLLGGIALILGSTMWAVRHPPTKGQPLGGERKAWMALPILGALLIIAAVVSL